MICLQCLRALLPGDGGMGSVMDEWKRRARAVMSLPSESSFAIDRMQRLLLPRNAPLSWPTLRAVTEGTTDSRCRGKRELLLRYRYRANYTQHTS